MSSILIFSTANSFTDQATRNSVNSWSCLPGCDIITLDNRELKNAGIQMSQSDAPIIPSFFSYIESITSHRILCYINADIILTRSFLPAVVALESRFEHFLMVGRRTNWHKPHAIEFTEGWEDRLHIDLQKGSKLFNAATDYFCFTRGVYDYKDIPAFALARYFWDCYLYYHVMQRGLPVIDATEAVLAVHQDHEPHHRSWDPDGVINRELAKASEDARIDLDDVPYYLTRDLELKER